MHSQGLDRSGSEGQPTHSTPFIIGVEVELMADAMWSAVRPPLRIFGVSSRWEALTNMREHMVDRMLKGAPAKEGKHGVLRHDVL
mgnify:CR=1 FL=1